MVLIKSGLLRLYFTINRSDEAAKIGPVSLKNGGSPDFTLVGLSKRPVRSRYALSFPRSPTIARIIPNGFQPMQSSSQ